MNKPELPLHRLQACALPTELPLPAAQGYP